MIEPIIQKLIENFIEDIEQFNLEKVYGMCPVRYSYILGQLTDTLIAIGIQPLEHMQYVPSNYLAGSKQTSIVIPDTVEHICESAFSKSDLNNLVIPASVQYLGNHTCSFSNNLKTIDLSQYEGDVPLGLCYSCKELETAKLPSLHIREVHANAFGHCPNLKQLEIDQPKSYVMNELTFKKGWSDYTVPRLIKCTDGDVFVFGDGVKSQGW